MKTKELMEAHLSLKKSHRGILSVLALALSLGFVAPTNLTAAPLKVLGDLGDGYLRVFGDGQLRHRLHIVYFYEREKSPETSSKSVLERLGWLFDEREPYSLWKVDFFKQRMGLFNVYIKRLPPQPSSKLSQAARRKQEAKLKALLPRGKVLVILEGSVRPKSGSFFGRGGVVTSIRTARSRPHYEWVITHETLGHAFARLKDEYPRAISNIRPNSPTLNVAASPKDALAKWGKIPGFNKSLIEPVRNKAYPEKSPKAYFYRCKGPAIRQGFSLMRGGRHLKTSAAWTQLLSVVEKHYLKRAFDALGP